MRSLLLNEQPRWHRFLLLLAKLFGCCCMFIGMEVGFVAIAVLRHPQATPEYKNYLNDVKSNSLDASTRPIFSGRMYYFRYTSIWQIPATYVAIALVVFGLALALLPVYRQSTNAAKHSKSN